MFKIEDKTIKVSRGDAGVINFSIPIDSDYYQFKVGDIIALRIYDKKGYNKDPLKTITTTVEENGQTVDITLKEEDTTIGEIAEKPITYWYDISLNETHTVVGYDDDGAAQFIIYPAKGGD